MDAKYRICTDGSTIGNRGPGGWGACFEHSGKRWEMSGSNPWTTIAEMELAAAVHALQSLPKGADVELRSDSEYLIYGIQVFVFRWRRQHWRNNRGEVLQNRKLWIELLRLNSCLRIQWIWVKGHNGDPEQCRAMPWLIERPETAGQLNRRPLEQHDALHRAIQVQ